MITAFILGFAGSLHCVGMCGPIVLALPGSADKSRVHFWFGRLLYNGGRLITYILLGLLFGAVGQIISLAGFQSVLSIALGTIIILSLFLPLNKVLTTFSHSPLWKKTLGRLFVKKSFTALMGIGILNGFLPCGLVYTALAGAVASGDSLYGASFMALFGLGTLPALLVLAQIAKISRPNWQNLIKRTLPAMAFILGILLILRGLSLGIPYVSPVLGDVSTGNELFIPQCH